MKIIYTVQIGKYTIKYSGETDEYDVWIIDNDSGEGGTFRSIELEKVIDKFYKDNF